VGQPYEVKATNTTPFHHDTYKILQIVETFL